MIKEMINFTMGLFIDTLLFSILVLSVFGPPLIAGLTENIFWLGLYLLVPSIICILIRLAEAVPDE